MKLTCIACVYDRLIGKTMKVLPMVMRTSKEAVTVMDGQALCQDHLAHQIDQKARRADAEARRADGITKANLEAIAAKHGPEFAAGSIR